jgi:hypothetical protein
MSLNMRNVRAYSAKTKSVLTLTAALFIACLTCNVALVSAATINVDGDPSDWTGIAPVLIDADDYLYDQLDIKEVYQITDGSNLYFRIEVYDSIVVGGYYRVFIDADKDPSTGMPFFEIGAEYQLGLYNGYGYGMRIADLHSFPVQAAYSGSTLELSVANSDLGDPMAFDFVAFCNPSDTAYPLGNYVITNDQTIIVDGDPSDWAGSPFVIDDTGDAVTDEIDLWGCYVGSNGTHLFAMVNTTGSIDPTIIAQIFVTRVSDMKQDYFYGPSESGWTVWEGSESLSDLGFDLGDEVNVSFTLMNQEGDYTSKNFFVIPETPIGVLSAVLAMLAALALVAIHKNPFPKSSTHSAT